MTTSYRDGYEQLRRRTEVQHRTNNAAETSDTAVVLAVSGTDDGRVDALADTVANVAGPKHALVHIVHVFSSTRFERTLARLNYDTESPPDPDEVAKRYKPIDEVAARLKDPIRSYGMPIDVHGRVADDTGATIVEIADDVDATHVIVGGRKRSSAGKCVFGSTAQYVLLNAPCPVTFVRGG
jgi:nucleotide-binding universal stress UspA family protein